MILTGDDVHYASLGVEKTLVQTPGVCTGDLVGINDLSGGGVCVAQLVGGGCRLANPENYGTVTIRYEINILIQVGHKLQDNS